MREASMRVPSIGLTADERRIVAEGYRLAEHMLRNYQDPPSLLAIAGKWLARLRVMVLARD
jgi:hypothetical protein